MTRRPSFVLTLSTLLIGAGLGVGAMAVTSTTFAKPTPSKTTTATMPSLAPMPTVAKPLPPSVKKLLQPQVKFKGLPLLTKSQIAAIAKVAPTHLEEPVDLEIGSPANTLASLRFSCASMIPASGGAVKFNKNACKGNFVPWMPEGAWVSFKAEAGKSYVVECTGRADHWKISVHEPAYLSPIAEQTMSASEHPALVWHADEDRPYHVWFRDDSLADSGEYEVEKCRITPIAS